MFFDLLTQSKCNIPANAVKFLNYNFYLAGIEVINIKCVCVCVCVCAVSYTHLDVYKRQHVQGVKS